MPELHGDAYAADMTNTVPEPSGTDTPGNLLAVPEPDAARQMLKDWDATHKLIQPRLAQWKVNKARRKGYVGVKIVKQQNDAKAYIPTGSTPSGQLMNKAARLARRLRSQIFADPPLPEATPASDQDQDRDAAEFATRVLQDL